ncbi:DegV family protein [Mechercharimyces sp. CAU 1602]|uniref:DegV family protein n=1 Tax=Mechercharimyces sp. CAU 1602 TaxID=2973933 RepID=UPI0021638A94|nr:DegV family protein [Mechercharimyces sp. CAU 1602]MCS1351657.1 DegV family protein [Mechercharimyces sp. CAU 1602]
MSKIAIVTDSSCDLPPKLLTQWGITVVPLRIHYKNHEYRDGVEISAEEVAHRLEEEIPKTSMPTPEDIYKTYEHLHNQGYTHCLTLTVAAAVSGTYNTFRLAAQEFEHMKIEVIDSKGVSFLLGFLVLEAARLVQNSTPLTDILTSLEKTKERIRGYFVLDTLEYLRAGGRIGKVASSLGSMLNIKPIITFDSEGKLHPHTVARGKKQAVNKLLAPIRKQIESTRARIAILHTRAETEAQALKEKLVSYPNVSEIYIQTVSPALMVHAGPGLLGIAIQTLEEA